MSVVCPGHSRPVPQLEVRDCEDGLFMISACLDGKPMLRDGGTGDWVGTFAGHSGAVWSARLNSNATRAATASADFMASYWCALTGACLQSFEHKHIVRDVAFSGDDRSLYTAGYEGLIRIFDLARPDADPATRADEGQQIRRLLMLPNGLLLSAASGAAEAKLWDMRSSGAPVRSVSPSGGEPITSLELSLDGKSICSAAGKNVCFWDSSSLNRSAKYSVESPVGALALDSERGYFVTGSPKELLVRKLCAKTGKQLGVFRGHHGPINALAVTPEGAFASGSVDGTIRIWKDGLEALKAERKAAAVGNSAAGDGSKNTGDKKIAAIGNVKNPSSLSSTTAKEQNKSNAEVVVKSTDETDARAPTSTTTTTGDKAVKSGSITENDADGAA